jgi:hypothetical protein
METWDGAALNGWEVDGGGAALSAANRSAGLTFAEQQVAFPQEDAVAAGAPASAGMMVGNYLDNGIVGVGFKVSGATAPSYCQVYFAGAAREWSTPVSVGSGEAEVTVPFAFGQWTPGDPSEAVDEADFNADLRAVERIGVRFCRAGAAEQGFEVDDFMLLAGSSFGDAAALYDFMCAYGVTDGTADDDGDGMSNSSEFAAGTDPTKLASALRFVDVSVDGAGRTVVSWQSSDGKTYEVWRADSPGGAYTKIATVTGTGGETACPDPSDEAGGYYKVVLP